jgi:hypothetical protein
MSVYILCGLVAIMSACASDRVDEQLKDETQGNDQESWVIDDQPEMSENAASKDEVIPGPAESEASQAVNCSIVQWCNAPGGDGTRCVQKGCSLGAALRECEVESRNACGTPVCPWVFVALNGQRFIYGSCL